MPCRCKKRYCNAHRYPEEHDCSYDFKEEKEKNKEKLIEKMRCGGEKMEKI
tara:strand:+ start:312 stop:464 length:153 start_codon:yes stop_codon:yes gene_type:complete